jgi:hypothetical protein
LRERVAALKEMLERDRLIRVASKLRELASELSQSAASVSLPD